MTEPPEPPVAPPVPRGEAHWGTQQEVGRGSGTGALVSGIAALLLCWTVVGGVVLGVVAVVLALVTFGRRPAGARLSTRSVFGLVLGVLGIVGAVLTVLFVVYLAQAYEDALEDGAIGPAGPSSVVATG